MYTSTNYKTKAGLKRDLAAGIRIEVYQPGGMFPIKPGPAALEGPHFPAPHTWYASCEVEEVEPGCFAVKPGTLK